MLVDREVTQLLGNWVVDEQCPATSSAGCSLEFAFPALVGTEVLFDAVGDVARWLAAAVWTHVLPEQRVEIVSTAVVGDVTERTSSRTVVAGLTVLLEGFLSGVETVDVA